MAFPTSEPVKRIGRYELHNEIAHGGMAAVHLGRLVGPVGFARTVAIKRCHPSLLRDQSFRDMFVDEARLAARIRHPNVVSIIDVVQADDELFLVMDFVQGVSLQRLMLQARKSGTEIPINVAVGIIAGALHGLHAAHEAKGDRGEPLNIVHRDVSPHNIMVATDGVPRVLDFGVAKAKGRLQNTTNNQVKGKFAYMPPEQVAGEDVGSMADVYAAGIVLWEMLTGRRLFKAQTEILLIAQVLQGVKESPGKYRPSLPAALDKVIMKAVSADASERFATAREFAIALEDGVPIASATHIGRWVEELAAEALDHTAMMVAEVESQPSFRSEERRQSDRAAASVTARSEAVTAAPPSAKRSGSEPKSAPTSETKTNVVTVVVPTEQTRAKKSAVPRYAVLALLALGAIGGLLFFLKKDADRKDATRAPASTGESMPAASAAATAATTVEATAAGQPTASQSGDEEAVTAVAEAEPEEEQEPSSSKARGRPRSPRSPGPVKPAKTATAAATGAPAPPTAAKPAADCDPPYTVDSRGIQRLKPHCL